MTVYVIPNQGDFDTLLSMIKKASVPLITPGTVREFIIESTVAPVVVAAVSPEQLLVLTRHAQTLLDEVPFALISVPGPVYTGDWVTMASTFPPLDYTELERKLAKSGHVSMDTKSLSSRPTGGYSETLRDFRAPVDRPRSVNGEEDDDSNVGDA